MTLVWPKPLTETATPPVTRGECPTLSHPMQTGDGLLARLRPSGNALSTAQLKALAVAVSRHGNGIIEITARGSLQARGLRTETVADFESAVLAAGIRAETGTGIETPPLAGIDPDELIDVRPLGASLRARISAHQPPLALAPKLAITVDGGGRFHLADIAADLKLTAVQQDGETRFLLAVGGTATTARPVGIFARNAIEDAVIAVLEALSAVGQKARGKDLDLSALGEMYDPLLKVQDTAQRPSPLIGIQPFPAEGPATVLGIAFAYCQASAAKLVALADAADALDAGEVRLAPGHGLFVTGLTADTAMALLHTAAGLGFLTEASDPRSTIALCAGAGGCASGLFETHALADRMRTRAPALLDGSFTLHLSACSKGCAHPAPSLLAVVGAPSGYGLVVNGAASSNPAAYLDENGLEAAWKRLAALVGEERQAGESAGTCLTRLGADRIWAALQLETQ